MKIPEPLWATVFAVLGVILAITCLFLPSSTAVTTGLIIASNLVSGALGALKSNSTPNSTIDTAAGGGEAFPGK